jgi:hypothetical protein
VPPAQVSEASFDCGLPPIRLEITTSISGVRFDECYENRILDEIDGINVSLIDLQNLKKISTGQISLNGVIASRRCFFVGVAIPFRQENVLNRRLPLRVLVLRQTPARTSSRWFHGNDICPVEKKIKRPAEGQKTWLTLKIYPELF